MFSEPELIQIIKNGVTASIAPETEITLVQADQHSLRFAENRINQNLSEANCRAYIRVIDQSRVGIAATNQISSAGINLAITQALTSAKSQ